MKTSIKLTALAAVAVVCALAVRPADAACIDTGTGTVDTIGDCIFGDKNDKDCRLAWSLDFDGAGNPPADPKRIECTDGDPCDRDGTANGVCTFHLGACVNIDTGTCDTVNVTELELRKPSAKDVANGVKKPQAVYIDTTLRAAFSGLLPSAVEACSDDDLEVRIELRPDKRGVCNSPVDQKCEQDPDCDDYCIQAYKKNKTKVLVGVLDETGRRADIDSIKLTCLPGTPGVGDAEAFQIASASDLIGGPLAVGRVGDYMIRNGNVRAVIRDAGRVHSFAHLNGGQIIDADLVRENPADDRDSWGAMQVLVNISASQATDTVVVLNDGDDGQAAIVQSSGPDDLFDTLKPDNLIYTSPGGFSIPPDAVDVDLPLELTTDFILPAGRNYIQIATTYTNTGGTDLDVFAGDYLNPSGQLEPFGQGMGYGTPLIRLGGSTGGQDLHFMAFQGILDGAGVTYGVIFPSTTSPGSTLNTGVFATDGVFVWLHAQGLLGTLNTNLGTKPPGALLVPAGGSNTLRRWFAIGESVSDITKVRAEIFDDAIGVVQGTVTVDGTPVANAHVTAINNNANFGQFCPGDANCRNVFTSDLTDENGFYRLYLPPQKQPTLNTWGVSVRAGGVPYEEAIEGVPQSIPVQAALAVKKKKTVVHNVDLPASSTLTVTVEDQGAAPLAARVSVVGHRASPDPMAVEAPFGLGAVEGRYFGSPVENQDTDLFGLADVRFADHTGSTGTFKLEPGTYHVVVSHGPEYDVHDEVVTISSGSPGNVTATLNRVVDTTGFVSIDTHVHMLNSSDSSVSLERRIITELAEGVDFFVSSDHDFVHDLTDDIATMGVDSLIGAAPSDEITTTHYGHTNVWPVTVDTGKLDGGALDWGRAGETNGQGYPSSLSYDLLPSEIYGAFNPAAQVIQLNHLNSARDGVFALLGVNTESVPPDTADRIFRCSGGTTDGQPCEIPLCRGGANDGLPCDDSTDCPGAPCGRRQCNAGPNEGNFCDLFLECPTAGLTGCAEVTPASGRACGSGSTCLELGGTNISSFMRLDPAVSNLYSDNYTALEMIIEGNRGQLDNFHNENLGDWFGLLNQGLFKTGVSDSDTHSMANVPAGSPRTYVASLTDDPASLSAATIALNVNAGRAIGASGLFMKVSLEGDAAATASPAIGDDLTVAATGGSGTVHVRVESATWAEFDRIEIYMNTAPECATVWNGLAFLNRSCGATPDVVLDAGTDFTINTLTGVSGSGNRLVAVHSEGVVITEDTWVVVVARGTDGVSRPLFPMVPQDIAESGNDTLADLTDSGVSPPWNLDEEGAMATAFSNPLFFDFEDDSLCHGGTACP